MIQEQKPTYHIRNWKEYNRALVQRGSITVWFTEETQSKWHPTPHALGKGRPQIYSDDAILCALLIRLVYRLPLRSLQRFLMSTTVGFKSSNSFVYPNLQTS
jgi:hypothetical protein